MGATLLEPKYHVKPEDAGWPSAPLEIAFPRSTWDERRRTAGTFQLSEKTFAPALPREFDASKANARAVVEPATGGGEETKSGFPPKPPSAPFVVTEVQQPAPLPGDTPPGIPRTDGSQGPTTVIRDGGSEGFPRAPLSGAFSRGGAEAPLSSNGTPAWKSKSKPHDVTGWTAAEGLTVGLIVIVSPRKTVAPSASCVAPFSTVRSAAALDCTDVHERVSA